MKEYENWEELHTAVQKVCDHILKNEIAPVAKAALYSKIRDDIYGAYTPKPGGWKHGNPPDNTYQRRYSLLRQPGGQGIYYELWKNHTLFVTTAAKASPSVVKGSSFHHRYPGALLALIESDNHGIWGGGFPRPAVANAEKSMIPKVEFIMRSNFDIVSVE